jgi:hypothetical protein
MSGYSRNNGRGKTHGNCAEKVAAKYKLNFAATLQQ